MDSELLQDFIGRQIGYYQSDGYMGERRDAQTIALAEVLRFIDGDKRMSEQLADYVPLTLADLPSRLGGS